MAGSKFDQVIECYVKSVLSDEEKGNLTSISRLAGALKQDLLSDVKDEEVKQLRKEAKEDAERYKEGIISEAENYKKNAIKKVERTLIYEAIFIAFLVGMVVNQATNLVPKSDWWAGGIILGALLICVLLVRAETGKD